MLYFTHGTTKNLYSHQEIGLSATLAKRADQQAARLGFSTPEYIRYLIAHDSRHTATPREKISEQAEKELFEDLIEFLKEDQKNPQPAARSAEDHQLEGEMGINRAFSITGNYRVIYTKTPKYILFQDVGTHEEVYER